jgi:hypothetical protein
VVDGVNQYRDAERIRQENELLPRVVAHVASLPEKRDALSPFFLRQRNLAHERVQMPD